MIVTHTFEDEALATQAKHLSLGFFDGLHLAHREVICDPHNSEIPLQNHSVFTFQTHPMSVIAPEAKPPLITGVPHKLEILKNWGIGSVILIPFDIEKSKQTAEDFLDQISRTLPNLKVIRCGPNWRFGYQRKGGIPMLSAWARAKGISLSIPQPVEYLGEWVSSSRIRQAIQSGNLIEASQMLGRPVSLYGKVVKGQQLGRQLGFPTINLSTEDECLPPLGVYRSTVVLANGERHRAVLNIGKRPTISSPLSPTISIEAHILDFNRNLYEEKILIELDAFIRSEKKFANLDTLKQAISEDIRLAKLQ